MKLEGEYTFDGPKEEVWKLIRDPEVLSSALPGTESLEQLSENEYQGVMNIRVGPVVGEFSGKITVSNEIPPDSCTLTVEGRGKPGFVNGTGDIQLTEQGSDKTLMKYTGDVQIGGRLASVGQRMIETASKSIIGQGLNTMNQVLQARVAAQSTGKEVEFTPPSESQFAASVARDMTAGIFSSNRLLWIIIIVLVILAIIVLLLVRSSGATYL